VWQSFAKIGPSGTSKNLWWEKDKTRSKYNSFPLSLERSRATVIIHNEAELL